MFKAASLVATVLLALSPYLAQAQSGTVLARTYRKTLRVTNELVSPDGYERLAVVAEGTLPGPLITTQKGDKFKINVVNELEDRAMLKTTSIHWHGLFMKGTNWADGATFINQCPIASGHSFLYEFPAGEHTNTYWWHSHHGIQYCDGLRGGLVIYDKHDPHRELYDFDDKNTVITLMDWFHNIAANVGAGVLPDSTLINGKGRYTGGPAVPLSVISVRQGKRYRMRLISLACDANFVFSIDGHELEIIETDGINTVPAKTDSIQIFAGQRYSFILNANQPKDNYWIRSLPNRGPKGFEGGVNSAILRYAQAPIREPTTPLPTLPSPIVETALAPLENPAAPGVPQLGAADVNIRLEIGFSGGKFMINGVSYVSPAVPVLLQILSGVQNAQDLLPSGSVYVLPRNKVIEVTVVALGTGSPHPFHLHGHTFSIIKGPNDTEPNFTSPARKDVYTTGGGGSESVIRFVTDNAGPWMFHCHIEFHTVKGMAVVFAADTLSTGLDNPVPEGWKDLCPIYNALSPEDQ